MFKSTLKITKSNDKKILFNEIILKICYESNPSRTFSRPLLGAISASYLVHWFWKKIILLEMVKNDICLGGGSKQIALFWKKKLARKTHPFP